uniref:Titin n=1 Tax=Pelusios castaneus TaxID=367368 RepID=A0A8C8R9T9_9SAUR
MAVNKYGVGDPLESESIIAKNPFVVPLPPNAPEVSAITKDSMIVVWERPASDGGSEILGYVLEKRDKEGIRWTRYLRKIVNVRAVGQDLKVEIPISGRPKPTVTWTKDDQPLKQTTRVNVSDLPNLTVLNIKETNKEDSGMYGITVANVIGQKSTSVEIITLDKPDPPRGPVKFDDISAESITLSWSPPLYTGGCQITNYIVHKRDTTTTVWETVSAAVARTTLKVTKLKTGSEYQFRIFAENRYGQSFALESEPIVAQYPYKEPGPPDTIVVNAGEMFKLEADVHGKPLPTIKWFKGDKEVEETARCEIKNTDFKALVIVKDAIRVDGGQYILQASNIAGTKSVPVNVKV